jgi:glycerol-3-phosphate dehydrogenase
MPLPKTCDLVVIGGGITGAGIFHETSQMGLKTVLLERRDFAWGTSSRSSKLIHGGLRYLKEGHLRLTRDAVRERERLLQEVPGLVTPIAFIVPIYKDRGPGRWTLEAGLSIYDLMAQKRQHRFVEPEALIAQFPFIERRGLIGAYAFWDAQVDDARLVLRLIADGRQAGGLALNYSEVVLINRDSRGHVAGVTIQDVETRQTKTIETTAVINATGCWADALHPQSDGKRQLRPLRGSHLIFPKRVLPIESAVSFTHPQDKRALFAVPWKGVVLVGTTDLDHVGDLNAEPAITPAEADYLLEGVRTLFPSLGLSLGQCIASISGLRPVISSGGNRAPSEESREHEIWVDHGLVTIAGGKLTTYRRVALDVIKAAQPFLPPVERPSPDSPGFTPIEPAPPSLGDLDEVTWLRLWSRYGHGVHTLVENARAEDLLPIAGTTTLWAELPYAAKHEWVRHLEDLMLRRVRIGLLLPDGGQEHLSRIGRLCRPALGWDRSRWRYETRRYTIHWQQTHGFPWRMVKPRRLQRLWQMLLKPATLLRAKQSL